MQVVCDSGVWALVSMPTLVLLGRTRVSVLSLSCLENKHYAVSW